MKPSRLQFNPFATRPTTLLKTLLLPVMLSATATVYSATVSWSDTSSAAATWQTGTNWSGGSAPATGDNATIGTSFSAAKTINLNGNVSLNNLTLTNTTSAVSILGASAGQTLTLTNSTNGGTGSAIYYNNTVTNTIGGANLGIILGSNITYDGGTLGSAFTGLSISGIISDGGSGFSLTKTGNRSLSLSGNNSFSGGLTIDNGTVFLTTGTASTNSLGTGAVRFNNSVGSSGTALSFGNVSRTYANDFVNNNSSANSSQAPALSSQNFTGNRVTTLSGNFTTGVGYLGATSTQTLGIGANGNSLGRGEGSVVLTGSWSGYTAGSTADGIRIASSGSVVINSTNALAPTNYSIAVNDSTAAGKFILNDAYTLNQKVTFAGNANGMRNGFGTRTATATSATLAGDSTGTALTVTDTDGGNVFSQTSGARLVISGTITGAGAGGLRINDGYTYTSADATNSLQTPGGTVEFSKSTGNTLSGPITVVNGTLLVNNLSGSGTGTGTVTVGTINGATTSPTGVNAANSRVITGVNTATAQNLAIGQSITGAGGTITGTITGITLGNGASNSTLLISTTITAANASIADLAFGALSTSATLGGSGIISGNVNVTGVLSPGNSIESLATGTLALLNTSKLTYELQDNSTTGADLVDITGNLSLAGTVTLDLVKIGGFAWNAGDKLTLLSYTGSLTANSLFSFVDGNDGLLTDDEIFTFDGTQWLFDYNASVSGNNFGTEATGTFVTMTAIPEPGTAMLLGGLGLLGLLRRRRIG